MTRTFYQSRINATSPGKAAMKIREKYKEPEGRLVVKWLPFENQYEYCIEVKE